MNATEKPMPRQKGDDGAATVQLEDGLGAVASSPSLPLVTGAITIDPADSEVLDILSKLSFVCAPIAHIFQRAGYPIPTHAEEEQGHIIMWMLGMYRDHGKEWRTKANATLNALRKANSNSADLPLAK